MAKFRIRHITKYHYEVPVRDSANQIMLYPVSDDFQEIIFHRLAITGNPVVENHLDVFNNKVGTFTHAQPHKELVIDSQLEVQTKKKELPGDSGTLEKQWEEIGNTRNLIPFIDFLRIESFTNLPEAQKLIEEVNQESSTPLQTALHFCSYVYENFEYKKGITTVETTLDEIWKIKSGVCQDFAHILLAFLRLKKIPARYVSGYICPDKNGMRGEGATHAWVDAFIPFYGWLGLDPTNNCIANENHVRLAVGKNFTDCSPVRGTYRGISKHVLEVAVSVAYEDGHSTEAPGTPLPIPDVNKNSFQRHQEMQMQQ